MSLFERNEYLSRLSRTKARMQKAGLDLLLVASPENINYLSGYAGWSFYTPQLLLVAMDDEEPTLIVRDMDVACADFSAFIEPKHRIGYPEKYVGNESLHPMEFVADFIRDHGWASARLGVEKEAHFFSVRSWETLTGKLPDARFANADLLVDWVRTVKSDAEMILMREAGELAGCAMRAAVDAISPGVRESDAVAELYYGHLRGTSHFGGGVPNSVLVTSGDRVGAPHLKWTDSQYRAGNSVNIELSGCRHQYHVALARTVILGSPAPELVHLRNVIAEGLQEAMKVIRPGALCEEVEAAFRASTLRHGLEKKARVGYSQGLCFQPTWIERTMSFQRGDRTPLEPNMTFHLHGGMWSGKHSLLLTESIAVTSSGVELLTHFPQDLLVKG